ncbi:MAG: AraC family transcriptional regulator [Bacteroidales bacterium]|nr:AraC family transcriptional regulator [Bacteroidales bacterium]
MKFNLIQISGIIAVALISLLAVYFIKTRKEKTGNNLYISFILLIYAIMILCSLILSSGIDRSLFRLAHIGNQTIFLIGPLIYFYADSFINNKKSFSNKELFHFVPFALATIYLVIKLYWIHIPITCRVNHILLGLLSFVHSIIYFLYTIQKIWKKASFLNESDSKLEVKSLKLLKYIVWGFFSILLIKTIFFVMWDISGYYNGCNEIVNLYFLTSFILLNILTYFILNNPQFFHEIKKYRYSVLNENEKQHYKEQLILLFENDKIYRNPLLSLNLLSKKLSIPSRYLSQILNESLGKSFYELVNWYRIKECIEQISDSNNSKTILEIAFEVGYNSKSTFNSAFVKHTGICPKDFRKKGGNELLNKEYLYSN